MCVCVLAQRHLCDRVCVFVSMLGPQKGNKTVHGCRLFCSAFQNTIFPPNSIRFMWTQKCEQAQNTSEDPLNKK